MKNSEPPRPSRPDGPIRRSATLTGHGHPAIRATHEKTFELTAEAEISERATCVVGVGTRFDDEALRAWALLRGRVRLTLTASASDGTVHTVGGEAVVNPGHDVRDRIVLRRRPASSGTADAFTWATDSTLTATDLDAGAVAALGDPATSIELTADEIGERRPLVLVAGGGADAGATGRTRWLWSQATPVRGDRALKASEASDAVARLTAGELLGVVLPSLDDSPHPTVVAFLATVSRETNARFAVLPRAAGPLVAVEALLASGLPVAPLVWLGTPQRLPGLPAMPIVFHMPADISPDVFGGRRVAVADTVEQDVGTAVDWLPASEAVTRVGALTVVAPADGPGELVDLSAVARTLAAAGIAPRTLSEALTPFGLTRKKLYALLKDGE